MRLRGKKKSLKPLELMADMIRVREAHSEEATSLVSEFWCHLKEISQCDKLRKLTSEVRINSKNCRKSVLFRPFIEAKVTSSTGEELKNILENIIKQKLNCNCREEHLQIEVQPAVIVFSFEQPINLKLENTVSFCGSTLRYMSHLETDSDNLVRSNFSWGNRVFGNEYGKSLSASNQQKNIVLIAFLVESTLVEESLTNMSYGPKALKQFSKHACTFLNPGKNALFKSRQREYDQRRDATDERKQMHQDIDRKRDPIRDATDERKQMHQDIDKIRNAADERKRMFREIDQQRDATDERKQRHQDIDRKRDPIRDATDERKQMHQDIDRKRDVTDERKQMHRDIDGKRDPIRDKTAERKLTHRFA